MLLGTDLTFGTEIPCTFLGIFMELGFWMDLRKDGTRLDTCGVGLGFMDFMMTG